MIIVIIYCIYLCSTRRSPHVFINIPLNLLHFTGHPRLLLVYDEVEIQSIYSQLSALHVRTGVPNAQTLQPAQAMYFMA